MVNSDPTNEPRAFPTPAFLDQFSEFRGATSIDGITCPFCGSCCECGAPTPILVAGYVGDWTCRPCGREFVVRTAQTPLGLAWQTWDRDPSPAPSPSPLLQLAREVGAVVEDMARVMPSATAAWRDRLAEIEHQAIQAANAMLEDAINGRR